MPDLLDTIGPRAGAAPLTITLTELGVVQVEAAYAHYDGSSAITQWLPALTIRAQNGSIISRTFPADTMAAGDTADVTFAPLLGGGGGGTSTSILPILQLKVFPEWGTLTTGDSKLVVVVSADLDGTSLSGVAAFVSTVSSAGAITVQVRNVTDAVDMLSTAITIDAGEFTSYTAATPPVVNAATAGVSTGDLIAIDVDGAGTDARGLGVILEFT